MCEILNKCQNKLIILLREVSWNKHVACGGGVHEKKEVFPASEMGYKNFYTNCFGGTMLLWLDENLLWDD